MSLPSRRPPQVTGGECSGAHACSTLGGAATEDGGSHRDAGGGSGGVSGGISGGDDDAAAATWPDLHPEVAAAVHFSMWLSKLGASVDKAGLVNNRAKLTWRQTKADCGSNRRTQVRLGGGNDGGISVRQ